MRQVSLTFEGVTDDVKSVPVSAEDPRDRGKMDQLKCHLDFESETTHSLTPSNVCAISTLSA